MSTQSVSVPPNSSTLLVGLPSHDLWVMLPSLLELERVGTLLERPVQFVLSAGSNIPRA